jgi:hypothetical protein
MRLTLHRVATAIILLIASSISASDLSGANAVLGRQVLADSAQFPFMVSYQVVRDHLVIKNVSDTSWYTVLSAGSLRELWSVAGYERVVSSCQECPVPSLAFQTGFARLADSVYVDIYSLEGKRLFQLTYPATYIARGEKPAYTSSPNSEHFYIGWGNYESFPVYDRGGRIVFQAPGVLHALTSSAYALSDSTMMFPVQVNPETGKWFWTPAVHLIRLPSGEPIATFQIPHSTEIPLGPVFKYPGGAFLIDWTSGMCCLMTEEPDVKWCLYGSVVRASMSEDGRFAALLHGDSSRHEGSERHMEVALVDADSGEEIWSSGIAGVGDLHFRSNVLWLSHKEGADLFLYDDSTGQLVDRASISTPMDLIAVGKKFITIERSTSDSTMLMSRHWGN